MASRKLATYRAKRDFKKTAEPSGAHKVAPSKQLRYVIQKHAATRLHYDLRLEFGGVFKSWAVTRGPSLNPHDKRLAVEVEDHPLDYGDFEGTIPKGEYGGGTVQMWDRGFWAPEPGFEPEKALKKGELKFVLAGERLNGGYVLVRLKRREGEKRNNWLLIKHRDEYAVESNGDAVLKEDKSIASGRPMADIAAGKGAKPKPFMLAAQGKADAVWHSNKGDAADARAAANSAQALPSTSSGKRLPEPVEGKSSARGKPIARLPDFIPPQLCRTTEKPPSGAGWAHEIKFDGYRMQMRVEKGEAKLFTRKGLDWTAKFSAIAKAGAKLPDGIYDGEICAIDAEDSPDFSALQAAISDGKTNDLIFFTFDLLVLGKEDLRALPLRERKARLKTTLKAAGPRLRYVEHFESDGQAVLEAARKMNLEGIISKRLDAPYRSERREDWTKTKIRAGHEVVIGGWTQEGDRFRSLLIGANRGDHLVYLGRVGTGFTQDVARKLAAKLQKLKAEKSPFSGENAPSKTRGVYWATPDLVAEIEFAGWSDTGIARQAAFKGLREDKPAGEVEAETPMKPSSAKLKPMPATVVKGSRSKDQPETIGAVSISSPEKVLWPAAGNEPAANKRDLAHYYEAVGDAMLAHVRGRPCSIIRAPDGIGGQLFFQRHAMQGASDLITQVKTPGEKKPYIQFDRVDALIAAGQIGALELHPWNCQPGQPEIPGRLVFDLDPAPDVAFARVIDAAKELRERLNALGLEAFCKTTGGKGLHVVTPFKMAKDLRWPEAKAFAQELCRQMADDSPELYLINMSKKARVGKIFLDYLRNDSTATAVAPFSPRARPGAPVSMPINWAQVRAGLDPMRYTLRTVPALLAKSKAWDDYCDGERAFMPAAKKLIGKRGR